MKKNLFDAAAKNEIIERANKLTEESERLWGSLIAAEMLHHCNEVLKGTMATYTNNKRPTFKQNVLKFLMLNFVSQFPKGAKTPARVDVKKNNIIVDNIHNEQQKFDELVNSFYKFKENITLHHPYFGNLSNKQWGIITWMHLDHHLRQFGV